MSYVWHVCKHQVAIVITCNSWDFNTFLNSISSSVLGLWRNVPYAGTFMLISEVIVTNEIWYSWRDPLCTSQGGVRDTWLSKSCDFPRISAELQNTPHVTLVYSLWQNVSHLLDQMAAELKTSAQSYGWKTVSSSTTSLFVAQPILGSATWIMMRTTRRRPPFLSNLLANQSYLEEL